MAIRRLVQYQVTTRAPTPFDHDFAPRLSWFAPLSEPVRILRRNNLYDEAQPAPPFDHDFAPRESWFQPLSEPVRQQLRNNNLYDEAQAIPQAIPPPTAWFASWSEPVRVPRRNTLYDEVQAPTPFNGDFAPVESWFRPWQDPLPVKKLVLFDIAEPITQTTATVPPTAWFTPFSDPVRVPARAVPSDQAEPIQQPAVAAPPVSWFSPWADPVRLPRRPTPSEQILAPPQVAPAVITTIPWTQALSEPVRVPPRTAFFDFTTFLNLSFITPVTVVVPRAPLFQPYRPIPPDLYSWDFFNFCLQPQFMPTTYIWDVRGPEPIDPFWVGPRPPPPPPPATVAQWFHYWDPPVRVLPRAPHFSPAAGPPAVVPLPAVVFNLVTTERKDAWSMTFAESVTPFTAKVGIVELPTPPAAVGVVEGPLPAGASGVAVVPSDAGNIGITEV